MLRRGCNNGVRLQHDRDGVSVERARAAPWLVCVCVLVIRRPHLPRTVYVCDRVA